MRTPDGTKMVMSRFEPSRTLGIDVRRAMDDSLWSSARTVLNYKDCDHRPGYRALPTDYAAYSDLVLKIPEWQQIGEEVRDEATAHLRQRLTESTMPGVESDSLIPRIRGYTQRDYSPVQLDRIARWSSTEEDNWLGLASAEDDELERVRTDILRALDYMEKADGELFGEVCAIVDSIIVVTPDRMGRFEFTAATSFATWGAIVANGDLLQDWTECYNMLAHEEGHLLLFALARDEPLVLDTTHRVFTSPVRDDARPMDGIYHAAFVAAREARALDRLLEWHEQSRVLANSDAELVRESLESSVITFWQCFEILDAVAQLSTLGRTILEELRVCMSAKFTLITD